jgi:hypothetical protein
MRLHARMFVSGNPNDIKISSSHGLYLPSRHSGRDAFDFTDSTGDGFVCVCGGGGGVGGHGLRVHLPRLFTLSFGLGFWLREFPYLLG